jgi:hypothetical protein
MGKFYDKNIAPPLDWERIGHQIRAQLTKPLQKAMVSAYNYELEGLEVSKFSYTSFLGRGTLLHDHSPNG